MKNENKLIRISAILLLSIAFLFLIIIDPYKEKEEPNEVMALLKINEKIFKPINNSELLKIFDGETAVVYLGKVDKEYSKILETLYKASLTSKTNNIYYINIENEKRILSYNNIDKTVIIEKEATAFFDELLSKLGSFSEIYTLYNESNEPVNSGYKTIYTPMVMFIQNGKILYTYYIDKIDMTDDELKVLYNVYTEGFKKINY